MPDGSDRVLGHYGLYLFYLGVLTASVAVGLGLAPLGVALLLSRRLRLGVQV